MSVNIPRITELFRKNLRGELSEAERDEFSEILRNEEFADLDRKLSGSKYVVDKIVEYNNYDHRKAFHKFRAATSQRTFLRRLPLVASVAAVLAIMVSVFLLRQKPEINSTTEETLIQAQQILPGNKKALIKLANGEVIDVADSSVKMAVAGVGEVSYEDGQITFTSEQGAEKKLEETFNELIVPRGGECMITLDDGTKVWMNSCSTLKYPVKFSKGERKVALTGEAFFDVTHDAANPFVVSSPKMTLTVKGTSFNLKDYEADRTASATLVAGRLNVGNDNGSTTLIPGHQARVGSSDGQITVKEVDTRAFSAWTENKFVFSEQGFDEILSSVSRWYDIDVTFRGIRPEEYSLTGKIPRDYTLAEVLELFSMITDATFRLEGRNLIVSKATTT